jgi:proteasome lid subunit RPN8/RPN11
MITPICAAMLLLGDLAQEHDVRVAMWQLMTETRYGFARREEAVFIVRGAEGELSFVRWPSPELPQQARWVGALPRGAVAIAHTHRNWIPEPSDTDIHTARRSGLPVYVVTRTRITRTDGRETRTVVAGEWAPGR